MGGQWKEDEFEAFLTFLKEKRGLDFTGYKRASVARRVARRLHAVGTESLTEYIDKLEVDPEEFGHLLNTILINVTAFFRDAPAWQYLEEEVIPEILTEKTPGGLIRTWTAGTASGEEAYSLAILFAEALGLTEAQQRVKIYATDVDEAALDEARRAVYSRRAMEGVPEEYRDKYFRPVGTQYALSPELRRLVIFGRHNLLTDAPISNLDLLSCRNTLMYFTAESQRRVLSLFHFALHNRGFLFLGKAEMLLTHANLFTPVHLRNRIFRKVPSPNQRERAAVLAQGGNGVAVEQLAQAMHLRETAAEASVVPELLVDANGILVAANGAARALLSILPDDIGKPLQELVISYRPLELRSRIDQVYSQRRKVHECGVEVSGPDGKAQYYDVDVVPLLDPGAGYLGVTVVFTEVTQYRELQFALDRSREDLQSAYEELQSTNEELETTNEELQSSNEELETTNEELQSANEEMETMNEELQSSNEELQAMNEQFRQSSELLTSSNLFMNSILTSVTVAVVAVDENRVVTSWNRAAENLWGLRSEEAEGEFLFNLDIGLPLEAIRDMLRRVVGGESPREETIVDATNRKGQQIRCRVLITPIGPAGRRPHGAVVMMEENDSGERPGF